MTIDADGTPRFAEYEITVDGVTPERVVAASNTEGWVLCLVPAIDCLIKWPDGSEETAKGITDAYLKRKIKGKVKFKMPKGVKEDA